MNSPKICRYRFAKSRAVKCTLFSCVLHSTSKLILFSLLDSSHLRRCWLDTARLIFLDDNEVSPFYFAPALTIKNE